MALVIVDKSAQFSNDLPVFGQIVSESSLKLGCRISSPLNAIDLSNNDFIFTKVGAQTYTKQGAVFDNDHYIETHQIIGDSSFTSISCFKVDAVDRVLGIGIAGNFETSYGGSGLYVHRDTFENKVRVKLRVTGFRREISTGNIFTAYPEIELHNSTSELQTTGWIYAVVTHDAINGTIILRIMNRELSTNMSIDLSQFDISYPARHPAWAPKSYKIGRIVTNTSNVNKVTIAEHFYHDRVLSDTEIYEQYQKSKVFLQNARGIDVSAWS